MKVDANSFQAQPRTSVLVNGSTVRTVSVDGGVCMLSE